MLFLLKGRNAPFSIQATACLFLDKVFVWWSGEILTMQNFPVPKKIKPVVRLIDSLRDGENSQKVFSPKKFLWSKK